MLVDKKDEFINKDSDEPILTTKQLDRKYILNVSFNAKSLGNK